MSRARPPTRVGIKEAPVCIVAGAFTLLPSYQQSVQFYADIDWPTQSLRASSVVGPRWEAGLGRYW
jgi:hypothetical protein